MKSFARLFVVLVAFFSVSALSAQIVQPTVNLDISDLNVGLNSEIEVAVDAGSSTTVPIVLNDALGLVLGLVSNVSVTVDGSPNFQVTDVKKGLLGLGLLSFNLKYAANLPSGSEETATVKINIQSPLQRAAGVSTSVLAKMKIR